MKLRNRVAIAAMLVSTMGAASAIEPVSQMWEEYDKLIGRSEVQATLGPDLFGDSVGLYGGTLSFSHTDVALQGNNSLPVAVTRTFNIKSGGGTPELSAGTGRDGMFRDWEIDLPHITGTYSKSMGWVGLGAAATRRCSAPSAPPTVAFAGVGIFFYAQDYWNGLQMNLGGGRGGELLGAKSGAPAPTTGGPYPWVTSDWTYVSCLPTIKNGAGEGYLAVDSQGTRYWLDWMSSAAETTLRKSWSGYSGKKGHVDLERSRMSLHASRVEDRFGNWVTYTYSNAATGAVRLTGIQSGDGRNINVSYDTSGFVSAVTADARTWRYAYDRRTPTPDCARGQCRGQPPRASGSAAAGLTAVVLPDQSRWTLDFQRLRGARVRYEKGQPGDPLRTCFDPGGVLEDLWTGTITHPSGASGEFTLAPIRFGRSNVLAMCSNVTVADSGTGADPNDENDDTAIYPVAWDALALVSKRVTGPGLVPAEWYYGYSSDISWFHTGGGAPGLPVCYSGDCISPKCVSDDCAGRATVVVMGPGEFIRYTFGNSYRYDEGKLLRVERGSSNGDILRSDVTTYELAQSGQTYPTPIGESFQKRVDSAFTAAYPRPQRSSTMSQQGATFSSTVLASPAGFDEFARPLSVTKLSSLNPGKIETTEYHDNLSKWVLGQASKATTNGIVTSETYYDATTALPIWQNVFGKRQHTLGYYADATLRTVTDGIGHVTTLSDWKRGVPGRVTYPDMTYQTAVIADNGTIASVTDESLATTGYTYDVMGRLASVTYPTGDATAWNPSLHLFEPVAISEYGIPAGHWRKTVSTGNSRKVTHFDALWRPLVSESYDVADPGTTRSVSVTRYDAGGRAIYQSYPLREASSYDAPINGTHTTYDALDRVTRVEQDSELGVLASITEYLSGFQTRNTNPRGFKTTQRFLAYDAPTYDMPVGIDAPEGVSTVIVRDVFGKPLQVTRSGPDG